jgi:hypothetical protein
MRRSRAVQHGVVGVVDRGAGLVKLRAAATFSSCGSGWRRPPPHAAPGGVVLLLLLSLSLSLGRGGGGMEQECEGG